MSKMPGIGVGIIIRRGNQVLLLHRKYVHGSGSWSTPGGHLDFLETPEECAIRETKEETSLDVQTLKFVALTNDTFPADEKHYVTLWMEAGYKGGEPILNAPSESDDIGWFSWNDLPQPLFIPFLNLISGKCYPPHSIIFQGKYAEMRNTAEQLKDDYRPGSDLTEMTALDSENFQN